MKSKNYRSDIKFIIIGDSCSGKTAFMYKFTRDIFREEYKPTIVSKFGF